MIIEVEAKGRKPQLTRIVTMPNVVQLHRLLLDGLLGSLLRLARTLEGLGLERRTHLRSSIRLDKEFMAACIQLVTLKPENLLL